MEEMWMVDGIVYSVDEEGIKMETEDEFCMCERCYGRFVTTGGEITDEEFEAILEELGIEELGIEIPDNKPAGRTI